MQGTCCAISVVATDWKRHKITGRQLPTLPGEAAIPGQWTPPTISTPRQTLSEGRHWHLWVPKQALPGAGGLLLKVYLPSLTSATVIGKLKNFFSHHGVPETVVSDNGTQFSSAEFRTFADRWNFSHVTSSPHYPQSNGAAERAVKTVKEILRQDDIFLALLSYRSAPIPDLGASPAELAMGRKLRTTMPSLPSTLQPWVISHKVLRERDVVLKRRQKEDYDRRHGVQPLPELSPGDPVLIKTDGEKGWKLPGEVVRKCAQRSFLVQTRRGHLRRNRRHLKQIPPSACNPDDLRHQKSGAVFFPDHSVRQEPYPAASSDQQPGVYLAGQPGTPVTGRPPSPPPSPWNTSFSSTQPTHKSAPVPAQSSVSTSTPVRTRYGRLINKPARYRWFCVQCCVMRA